MPINLPTYEQQQQAITLLQEIGVDVDTLLAGRVVKSVQRGTVAGPDSTTNVNITISTVDPSKCEIIVGGKIQDSSTHVIPISLTNTNLVLGRATTSSSNWAKTAIASWQVIEFY